MIVLSLTGLGYSHTESIIGIHIPTDNLHLVTAVVIISMVYCFQLWDKLSWHMFIVSTMLTNLIQPMEVYSAGFNLLYTACITMLVIASQIEGSGWTIFTRGITSVVIMIDAVFCVACTLFAPYTFMLASDLRSLLIYAFMPLKLIQTIAWTVHIQTV
jgi:hypothetical protein